MKRRTSIVFVASLLFALAAHAQANLPDGWFKTGSAPADYDAGAQAGTRRPGDRNAFLRARSDSKGFATLMQTIDATDYRGKRLRLSGWLKTTGANKAALWMRVDGDSRKVLSFDNMDDRPVTGTTDWKHYDVVLDVPQDAIVIAFGFNLIGKGEVLADDFKLEAVSKDVQVTGGAAGPRREPVNLDFAR
ncbi:hypothetical protein [Dyella sp.]|uniref:hypothetical protein n=1 Tax=Dyella sp. TaxID=1869338 RepID=UPI002ED5972E